jgi:transcription antitermination factor NusG
VCGHSNLASELLLQSDSAEKRLWDKKGGSLSLNDNQGEQWFALQVRSNYEKLVQMALQAKGYPEFLPVYHKRARWSDRMKKIEAPLFPGYVFGKFHFHRRLPILTIPGLVRIVGAGSNPEPVDEAELDAVRAFAASGLPVMPWPFLQAGDRVLIENGSLAGLEGILLQSKSHCRVVISVELLQRSVAVEIDRDSVRPVSYRGMCRPGTHVTHHREIPSHVARQTNTYPENAMGVRLAAKTRSSAG